MIAGAIVCAVGLALLLAGEAARSDRMRFAGKPLASAGFLVAAALAHPHGAYAWCVAAGLALGAIGDVALLFARGFLLGLGAFLLGHLAYAVAVAQVVSPAHWAQPIALAPLAAAGLALAWLWPHLAKQPAIPSGIHSPRGDFDPRSAADRNSIDPARLRGPVIAYIAVITAMVIAALALGERRFLVGALLFFASDLSVARDKFVAPGLVNRAWGLPAYYAGQLLIAWSLA